MKVDKYNLKIDIEHIIGEGVLNAEEIDVTTNKIMSRIQDLIKIAERADPKKVLK